MTRIEQLLELKEKLTQERDANLRMAADFRAGLFTVFFNDKAIPREDSARDSDRRAKSNEEIIATIEQMIDSE